MKFNKRKFLWAMVFATILLDVIPWAGFIGVGNISITTMHIPTIITSIVLGPVYGVVTGAVFGFASLLRAVSRESTPMDVLFINPLISLLPRVAMALITGYLFHFLSSFSESRFQLMPTVVSSLAGVCANTFFVFMALYLLCTDDLVTIYNLTNKNLLQKVMLHDFMSNMVVEAFTCVSFSTLTTFTVSRIFDKNEAS